MIQFNQDEVCKLIKAVTYYRDIVTGSDEIWDRYNDVAIKLHNYGEEVETSDRLSCSTDK